MSKQVTCNPLDIADVAKVPISSAEYNNIVDLQNEVLVMIASHESSSVVLSKLCNLAESFLPNSVASIMLLDKQSGLLSVLSAPSIPEVGHEALKNLKPGIGAGSCGNAVFHKEAQYVNDTLTDERWADLRKIVIDFNLLACWSMPIRNKNDEVIGTFALSSFEHRSPSLFHKKLLETASSIVSIVLQNRENENRLKLFSTSMQNATEGMIITDSQNKIIEVNKAFEDIYGYTENDVLGKNPKILSANKNTKEFYANMWKEIQENSKWSDEIINKRADGKEITQWLSISDILLDSELNTHNYLGIFTDLSELKSIQARLEETAFRDNLTHLGNKIRLDALLTSTNKYTLILLNINNFSYINTAYGFDVGDELLKKIAKILDSEFSATKVFRINSDEFGLLYDGNVDILLKVENIKHYFYTTGILLGYLRLNVSFTYGGTCESENLLRNASSALKVAKQSGKNNVSIFDLDATQVEDRKAFIEANNILYNALAEDKLVPYYQGIRDNFTKKIEKYEVLARIERNGEVISPYKFLEPARLSGLLPEITKIMIDKSFQEMASNTYTFSINITEDDLNREYLLEYLNEKSRTYAIDKNRVILEILEGVSSDSKSGNIEQLNALKKAGYALAIDDFGAEYSNFERVLDLEVDFLKIDAKYIKDINTNAKSYEVARAIAFFANNAKIPCIAEFVHNEEVQAVIDELDIGFSQGYHFSEPQRKPL
ncbi:EAL domain-containing protein [Sulfurimonas sp. SAG-AH-194-I05]|nr:EAL domain-containing protein [Sulfurimonas sp. SAG-AH-194-I05]MDF1875078.1 EAL domain-containing protein [Sulfurimonas sp. SAG-AH-194-I05]